MYFIYISTYLGNMLVIKQEISSLIIVWLCILKKNVADNINSKTNISHNNFKI